MRKDKLSGFTLIELLVVMGILAVLATATALVINPANMLAQARDSRRMSDLEKIDAAFKLHELRTREPISEINNVIYVSLPDASPSCGGYILPGLSDGWSYVCAPESSYRNTDGTGWIPVDLSGFTSAKFDRLPIDPKNNSAYFYSYVPGRLFTASMESKKFLRDVSNADGGANPIKYELGNFSLSTRAVGLVGYWRFDEGAGVSVADSSGQNNNGSIQNGAIWTAGQIGGALSFDGVDDYVNIPHHSSISFSSEDFSISLWVMPINPHPASWPRLISKGSYNTDGWDIYIDRNTNSASFHSFQSGANQSVGFGVLSNTQYSHIVVSKSGTTVRTYVNGSQISSGTIINPLPSTRTLTIGRSSNGSTAEYSKAVIDDVRIYNHALTSSEIQSMYNAQR